MKSFSQNKVAMVLTMILVLLMTGSVIALWYVNSRGQTGMVAEITQDGKVIETIHLDTVTEPYTLKIEGTTPGVYNLIEVRPGEIGIIEASCPDDLCVHMGFIHSTGIPITCLPNKLVIHIISDSSVAEGPDTVVY